MLRFILTILLFLCSLLNFFPIPGKFLWYLGIAVPEFPWVWMILALLFLFWNFKAKTLRIAGLAASVAAFLIFLTPVVRAYSIAQSLDQELEKAFGIKQGVLKGFYRENAFSFIQMFSGIGAKKIPFKTYEYAVNGGAHLSLNIYPSQVPGIRPCLIVVHGGSWKKGSNAELPDVNCYFAKAGYQVATINYRLAPGSKFPSPQEDVAAAIAFLKANSATLNIDPLKFVLLGRSAGGQIVLNAAYALQDPSIKGVISFYGPTDMHWAYAHPDNPLVMDSRQVMRDFLGDSPDKVPSVYDSASPTHHLNTAVPTLLVHGMNDAHVHYDESQLLDDSLEVHHVPHFLLGLPWATHGCEYSLNGPSGQLAVYAMERFLFQVTQ